MTLHPPDIFTQIVDSYIDSYCKLSCMSECCMNSLPGWTNGGQSHLPSSSSMFAPPFVNFEWIVCLISLLCGVWRVAQVGSSGDVIVGHFAISYHEESIDLCADLTSSAQRESKMEKSRLRSGPSWADRLGQTSACVQHCSSNS